MRLLITGSGGQLGHDLLEIFHGSTVTGLDHQSLDISDRAAVEAAVAAIEPSWVINAAAYNDVDRAETDAGRAFAVNGAGPGYLAEAARRAGAGIVHISTDYVFDGHKGSAYVEDDTPNPLSVYGRSKLEGEQRVLNSGASACVLRTAWLYGAHGKNFVKTIRSAAAAGGPLRVVADQVGSPTWTRHLAQAMSGLMQSAARGLFHVVNAGQCSRYQMAQAIVGGAVEVIPITSAESNRPAPRPPNSALRSARWQQTGLPALVDWEVALASFLETL